MSKPYTVRDIPETPLRHFTIHVDPNEVEGGLIELDAHVPRQQDNGGLEILRIAGGIYWTVLILPAGWWSRVDVSLPTAEDLQVIDRIREIEQSLHSGQQRQEAAGTMVSGGGHGLPN